MLESQVEDHLISQCRKRGWLCWKFTSPSNRSVPDRVLLLPFGLVAFVELKAPGKEPTPKQAAKHKQMRKLGHLVGVADSKEAVDAFVESLDSLVDKCEIRATLASLL